MLDKRTTEGIEGICKKRKKRERKQRSIDRIPEFEKQSE